MNEEKPNPSEHDADKAILAGVGLGTLLIAWVLLKLTGNV